MSHPDETEAHEWVEAEIQRLRSRSYEELLVDLDTPIHYTLQSRTSRALLGETQVFWDGDADGPLRVTVDICELIPGHWVPSIVYDDFIRAPDGSFIDE